MWFVRCLLWVTPLAFAGYWLSGPYHRALVRTAFAFVGRPVAPGALVAVDLSAANVLALYAAMCLASVRTPRSRRLGALGLGLVLLVAIEWTSGVVSMRMAMLEAARGGWSPAIDRARDQVLDLIRWIGVPAIWIALLGRWELRGLLPGLTRGVRRTAAQPVGGRTGVSSRTD